MRTAVLVAAREDSLVLRYCSVGAARALYVEWVATLVVPANEARATAIGVCAVLVTAAEVASVIIAT